MTDFPPPHDEWHWLFRVRVSPLFVGIGCFVAVLCIGVVAWLAWGAA